MTSADGSSVQQPVAAVVFDWYGTLGRPLDSASWTALRALVESQGGTVREEAISDWQAMPIDHADSSTSRATYDEWTDERLREFFQACSVPDGRIEATVAQNRANSEAERLVLVDGARAAIERLRDAGLLVAVCSNWDWDLDRHLAHNAIVDQFDLVVCSAVVGYRKPHRAIFDIVIDGLGVDAGSMLFVGDDLDADIGGATAAGMRAVHAAWAIDCVGGHSTAVACCATYDELFALPELAAVCARRGSGRDD